MKKTTKFQLLILILCLTGLSSHAQIYKDTNASIDDRVKNLLGLMTLDEKIGQMAQGDFATIKNTKNDISTYFMGSVLNGGSADPTDNTAKGWADMYDDLQSYALKTRLGIPIIHGVDAVHGHNNVSGAVIFPHNIALGCTRNPSLIERASRVTAIEVAATGTDWAFAPCIAVPQNERWGRTYEGFGETTELAKMFAPAAVKGLQGSTLNDPSSVVACAKHFVAEGATTNGQNQGDAIIDIATLRNVHLPGYIEAIKENVGTVMASYNSWNGVKCHGSKYLLTDLLKTELGFKGFVISDWDAIDQIPGDYSSDIEISVNAGIDMVMVPSRYVEFCNTLKALVQAGKISQARIDDAVSRILSIKFQLGLFERPYTDRTLTTLVGSADHRLVARECVRQSLVVLQKKEGVLPLVKTGMKIHVAGKSADNLQNQCGGWSLGWQNFEGKSTTGTTILQAIKNKATAANVSYSVDGSNAAGANIAVVVIGETPYAEGSGDKADLSLDMGDIEVVRTLKARGIPVVVVLVSGRPLIINSIIPYCDAIIAAWLPGTEGDGVADVLFGDNQPVGVLGHSWPRSMKQIPINVGDANYNPLFPYNHGLKSLSNAPVGTSPEFFSAATLALGDTIKVSFNKPMSDPALHLANFTVKVNGSLSPIKKVVLNGSDNTGIFLILQNPVKADDIVTFSYMSGTYASMDNGLLASIVETSVYNILDELKLIATAPGKIEAENFISMNGIQLENTADTGGGKNVGYIDNNDWLDYKLNATKAGNYKVNFRVASSSNGGQIKLMNGTNLLATINIPVTGGWQTWTTVTETVTLPLGPQTLRVFAQKGGWNFNWFSFESILETSVIQINQQNYLFQVSPNPFKSNTKISFSLPSSERVKLEVFNANGQKISTLVNGILPARVYNVKFDGSNFAQGLYLVKLQVGDSVETRKMILTR